MRHGMAMLLREESLMAMLLREEESRDAVLLREYAISR
jgi:hypothetical protein